MTKTERTQQVIQRVGDGGIPADGGHVSYPFRAESPKVYK